MAGKSAPWVVSDELWELVEPLIPETGAACSPSGAQAASRSGGVVRDLVRVHTGIAWMHLPPEPGDGSGYTCWRRLDEWQRPGVWEKLHALLLARIRAAGEIEWSRAIVDSSHVQAKKGAPKRARARSTGAEPAPSTTSSSTRRGSRSPTLRPRQTPPPRPQAGRHTRDRPPPDRARLRPRQRPLGRRTHLRSPAPVQTPARPLPTPRRHARSHARPPLLPGLPPTTTQTYSAMSS